MIEANGLRKRFGARGVLDGVTFSVPQGEVFGLIGSNGSGKTTCVRILATLLAADDGDATVAGHSVRDDPAGVRSAIGYVPDAFGMYPRLTAEEYLGFYAALHRRPGAHRSRQVAELLELVGLAEQRHDFVERLSRGQRQRLCLGRALVHDPSVLLLDDDGAGLDPPGQVEVADLLGELHGMGKTILISIHNLVAARRVCTWVGVLHGGAMVAAGPMAEVAGADGSTGLSESFRRLTGQAAP